MTERHPLAPELVARAGEALMGEAWQNPLSTLLLVNERTMRRIAKAAREGQDYPVSPGLLEELAAMLRAREAEAKSTADAIAAYLATKA